MVRLLTTEDQREVALQNRSFMPAPAGMRKEGAMLPIRGVYEVAIRVRELPS
jgi:hypothetical protein